MHSPSHHSLEKQGKNAGFTVGVIVHRILLAGVLSSAFLFTGQGLAQSSPPGEGPPASEHADHKHPEPNQERLADILAVLEDIDPELSGRVKQLREKHPQAVGDMLGERIRLLSRLLELREHDSEMYQLRVSDIRMTRMTKILAKELHWAEQKDSGQAQSLREQLVEMVQTHDELRTELRQLELDRLESRLAQLKTELAAREIRRNERVFTRVQALLDQAAESAKSVESSESEED